MLEGIENLSKERVEKVIENFPYKPRHTRLIVTANTTELDPDEPDLSQLDFDEWQYVVAVGSHITDIKPGDKVCLDLEKMLVEIPVGDNSEERVKRLKINPVEYDGRYYALIFDSYVSLVYDA